MKKFDSKQAEMFLGTLAAVAMLSASGCGGGAPAQGTATIGTPTARIADSTNTANSGNSGNSGSTANSGNSGNSGSTANSGNSGNSGSTANSGNSGNSGSTANSGNSGNSGSTANSGNSGNSGSTGNGYVPGSGSNCTANNCYAYYDGGNGGAYIGGPVTTPFEPAGGRATIMPVAMTGASIESVRFGSAASGFSALGDSFEGATKDTDLQAAALADAELDTRANNIAARFQMDYEAARQLTQLADKVQAMNAAGAMSDADRAAILDSTLAVAGLSAADVNKAIQDRVVNGNAKALDALLDQGAKNLGMPDSAGLRDEILPALGIQM